MIIISAIAKIYDRHYSKLADIEWDFNNSDQDELSRLHPYPARFIEAIPKNLIGSLVSSSESVIFDPFCGSGTTLREAQRAGFYSIGVDLNPIACLISKVKTSSMTADFESAYVDVIEKACDHYGNEQIQVPNIPNLDHWFNKDIQMALSSLVFEIEKIDIEQTRENLLFCLSAIIVRVSNQDSDTRYAAIKKNTSANEVFRLFELMCKKLYRSKETNQFGARASVLNKDILSVRPDDIERKVDLVITSPPYPNAYEYWLYHKYRMWWLGYDPISVRSSEIGARPHYHKRNGQTEIDFAKQMDTVFNLFDSTVNDGGFICIVIGRSIIKGRYIDNANLISDIAANHSYKAIADIERNIDTTRKSFNLKYGNINTENILVYRKGI